MILLLALFLAGCTTAMPVEPRLPAPVWPGGAIEDCQRGVDDACRRLRVFERQYERFLTIRERVFQ